MAKHTVAVGLNIGQPDGTEVRFERGDAITPKHIEAWMLDDGLVVVGDLPIEVEGDGIEKTGIEVPLGETGELTGDGELADVDVIEVDIPGTDSVDDAPESEG